MLKDDYKKTSHQQLQQDLQFMLSSIRARQNTLIFYLEKFKNSHINLIKNNSIEMKLAKNQFQQKDKIYSRQVTSILQKYTDFSLGEDRQIFLYDSSVRAFWIKLKTILKVSIERITGIGIGIEIIGKLLGCYQRALVVVKRNSQAQKSLLAYRQAQNFFKKRTIEALLLSKQNHSPSVSYSQSKMQKNRSQTLFKPTQGPISISRFTIDSNNNSNMINMQDSQFYQKRQTYTLASKEKIYQRNYEYLHGLADIKQEGSNLTTGQGKMKSLNRIKNRRPDETIKANIMNFIKVEQLGKLKSTSKASQKNIKKINKHVQRYQKNFQGAFDGKYEVSTLLDKKKTIFENIYLLYDDLFAKNIPNHKMISKFMFNTTKINQILYNAYAKKKKQNKKEKEKEKENKDKDKDKDKEKQKQKQKQKQKVNTDGKEKQSNNGNKKNKDKQKEKEKQKQKDHHANEEKQRHHTAKNLKAQRKHHLVQKDNNNHINIFGLNTKQRQHLRDKKQSQTTAMTAMTSKNQTHHKQLHNEKHQKIADKEREKADKEKQKKIMRSKTAKIKLNSDIQNPHNLVMNANFLIGKHLVSQHHTQKVTQKAGHTEKIVKTSGT